MEKNNQPLIITAIIVGAALIIALALIFTRNGDDVTTETADENNVTQNGESNGETENGEDPDCDSQEAANNPECLTGTECADVLKADGSCVKQITCDGQTYDLESDDSWLDENGVRRTVCEPARPQTGILPDNWEQLTPREKTNLNPFDCDIEAQYVRADNGQCQDKPTEPEAEYVTLIVEDDRDCLSFYNLALVCAYVLTDGNLDDEELEEIRDDLFAADKYACLNGMVVVFFDHDGRDGLETEDDLADLLSQNPYQLELMHSRSYGCQVGEGSHTTRYVILDERGLCWHGPDSGECIKSATLAFEDSPTDEVLEGLWEVLNNQSSGYEVFTLTMVDYNGSHDVSDYDLTENSAKILKRDRHDIMKLGAW